MALGKPRTTVQIDRYRYRKCELPGRSPSVPPKTRAPPPTWNLFYKTSSNKFREILKLRWTLRLAASLRKPWLMVLLVEFSRASQSLRQRELSVIFPKIHTPFNSNMKTKKKTAKSTPILKKLESCLLASNASHASSPITPSLLKSRQRLGSSSLPFLHSQLGQRTGIRSQRRYCESTMSTLKKTVLRISC